MRARVGMLLLAGVCAFASPARPLSQADPSLADAERLMGRKDYRGAEALLRTLVAKEPANARAHGDLALTLLEQGKHREAVDEARLSAAFGPDAPEAHYIYGLALSADGRPVDAARELAKAVEMKPDRAPPYKALAQAYAAAEDERTAATFEKYVAMKPDDAVARRELAEYLWRIQKDAEGNRVMEEAVRAFPSDAALRLSFGRSLAQQSLYADASKQLEKARELGATDAVTTSLLSACYSQAGDLPRARAVLVDGTKAHPGDASLLTDLGRLWLAEGQGEEALPPLEEAARLQPKSAEIRLTLGRAQESVGRTEAAEASYREAVRLAPNLPGAHYALGRLLVKVGRKADGEAELAIHHDMYQQRLARASSTETGTGEITLAWALLNQGKAAEALARFDALPESADSLRGKAAALSRLNRHAEAVRALERARQLAPDDQRIDLLLAAERSQVAERK